MIPEEDALATSQGPYVPRHVPPYYLAHQQHNRDTLACDHGQGSKGPQQTSTMPRSRTTGPSASRQKATVVILSQGDAFELVKIDPRGGDMMSSLLRFPKSRSMTMPPQNATIAAKNHRPPSTITESIPEVVILDDARNKKMLRFPKGRSMTMPPHNATIDANIHQPPSIMTETIPEVVVGSDDARHKTIRNLPTLESNSINEATISYEEDSIWGSDISELGKSVRTRTTSLIVCGQMIGSKYELVGIDEDTLQLSLCRGWINQGPQSWARFFDWQKKPGR